MKTLSFKKLIETLKGFGLNRTDAKIYVHLAKKGPSKARTLYTELKLTKQQLYPCLQSLQKKGMIYAKLERPAVFYALPFEKVLDLFTGRKINEAEEAQKRKAEILNGWHSTIEEGNL
jgi:sugar-specific transcriptional regulator TrmB